MILSVREREAHFRVEQALKYRSEVLSLARQELSELPVLLQSLTQLKWLDLSHNALKELPEWLGQLSQLIRLDVSYNSIKQLPEGLSKLTRLQQLILYRNQLEVIPNWLAQLTQLRVLNLGGIHLKITPQCLSRLTKLEELHLWENQLKEISESLRKLEHLEQLYLRNNLLNVLPNWLGKFTHLQHLDLSNNRLERLPRNLGELTELQQLDVSNNQLKELPASISSLPNLVYLDLKDNPIEEPPPEIVEKGINAIKNYFRQIEEEGKDYIYEAKLLIVGEGGAGKTSLANKIKNPGFQLRENQATTEGIDIIRWEFPIEDGKTFRVNIWDFGGQEIYHATHQFFLTKRSLYVLVADTRKDDTDFYYWLNVVELLSKNSPLLIIKNEKQDRHREINERLLRAQFVNLEKVLATNLATNRGLSEIISQIKHYITDLPQVGTALPRTWTKVRTALENDTRNYISLDEYLRLCELYGFEKLEDKLQLSGYLHDLGVCLHFQEDPLLMKTVILKPQWGTSAVYKVLDNKTVINNLGNFSRAKLTDIWSASEYAGMHDELLQLMVNFRLCYRILDSNHYIAPQLLTENQPEYDWDDADNLLIRYTYPFMPKGIIIQFIVVMHDLIFNQKYVWKSGVILERNDTKAEIIEFNDRREIKVRVSGKHKKELMTIVTYELDKIHTTYNRLKYNKLIPCNCAICRQEQEPHFYPYEILQKFKEDRQDHIQCSQSYQMVDVRKLIDDVVSDFQEALHQKKTAKVESKEIFDVFLSHNSKDKNTVRIIGEKLKARGLRVWLDEWELIPGRLWQDAIEEIIRSTKSAAVLVGKDGLGPWEIPEMRSCLSEFVSRKMPVIPVLLPGTFEAPQLPMFLNQFTWVDLRSGMTDVELDRLQWGITGKKP